MTKKQIAALRRILEREMAEYQVRSGRPVPGQHPSEEESAITDGDICILMNAPIPGFPMGERMDSLARIVHNERKSEAHFPVPTDQIDISRWKTRTKRQSNQSQGVELFAPIIRPEQLCVDDLNTPTEVTGKFSPQLLVDAAEAVGGNPFYFLGFGPFNSRFPSLLVMPSGWTEIDRSEPMALVFPLRI